MADLESYVNDVENKTNTEEQDNTFFELSIPYIEKTIMAYYENQKAIVAPIDKKQILVGKAPVDKHVDPKQLTEAEETAAWETLVEAIVPAVKQGLIKAKKKVSEVGDKLGNAAKASIASAQKKLQSHLSGFKIGGQDATASPAKK